MWEYYDELLENKNFKPLFSRIDWERNNYFRYPIIVKDETTKEKIYNYMRENNIILGKSWSGTNIVPLGTDIKNARYIPWSCPVSEDVSKRILTLPNHYLVSLNEITKVVQLLNNFEA